MLLVLLFVLKYMSNILTLTDEGVVVEMGNEIQWALIQLVLVFVEKCLTS